MSLDDFIRKEKYENPTKSEELKDELTFNFSDFNKPEVKQDLYALSRKILNLLLIEPGTYPDTPDLGIDIAKYQFDLLTDETLLKIQGEISRQVEKYIPTSNIQRIICVKGQDEVTQKKELIIGIAVFNGTTKTDNFFILVDNNSNELNTKIIFG